MKLFVFIIGVSIIWTSISHAQSLLLSDMVPLNAVPAIRPHNVKSDLDILIRTLEKTYGGKGLLPQGQVEGLMMGLKDLSVHPAEMSSERLCNEIGKLTERIDDFHLSVQIGGKICQRIWPKAMVGPNSGYGGTNGTWSLSAKNINGKIVSVLAIQKMSPSNSPEWSGFLEAVSSLRAQGKPFIIDLRRNPGADSTKGKQMAAILYGLHSTDEVPMPNKTVYRQRGPEACAVIANSLWLQIQSLKENFKAVPEYLSANYQSLVSFYNKALQIPILPLEIEELGNATADLANAIQFPIYVLIDRNCGSSCELTLEALENLPTLQTVGENTLGIVQFGNVGVLHLPSSHIVVRLSTQGARYKDGRQVEKIGYAPKWKSPQGIDALNFALDQFFR